MLFGEEVDLGPFSGRISLILVLLAEKGREDMDKP